MNKLSRRSTLLATAVRANKTTCSLPSNFSLSSYSQAVRRLSSKRGLSTQPTSSDSKISPLSSNAKKSSFPIFTLTATVAFSCLAYLAYEVDQESPRALSLAEYPYVEDAVEPFIFMLRQLREYGLLEPKPSKQRPRSPSPTRRVEEVLEREEFNDVQSHDIDDSIDSAKSEVLERISAVNSLESDSQSSIEAIPQPSSENELENVTNAAAESEILNEVVEEANITTVADETETVVLVEENTPHTVFADAPLASDENHLIEQSNDSTTSPLPQVAAENSFHSIHSMGSVGEVMSTVAKNSIALRHELEAVLLKDIHKLDADALRIRITQLAAEMFERLSWETIRLSHSVRQVENELTEKYEGLMAKQRKELEFEVHRILFDRECELNAKADAKIEEITKKYQDELNTTIKAQADGFQATLQRELDVQARKIHTELQDQLNHQVAVLRKSHSDVLLSLHPKIECLQADLRKYDEAIDSSREAVNFTLQSHAVSSAVLGLEFMLSNTSILASRSNKTANIASKLKNLKELCQDDALVVNLLNALPQRVQSQGALTLPELQVRFQVMRDEVRKAALAPEAAPKMIGQLVGTFLASISAAPRGLVTGQGTEEILARAAYYLDRGKIKEALKELDSVQGYSKILMEDWKDHAKERLIVDQALRTLKADSIIRHKSYSV